MSVLKGVPEEKHPPRQPVPMQWEVGTGQGSDGLSYVVVELRTAAGETTLFMQPVAAEAFAAALMQRASEAKSKLTIAGPEHLRAMENGNREQRRHPDAPPQ